ncbi:MAG: hypothetical protein WBS24_04525 [Terriglobales bacterium]
MLTKLICVLCVVLGFALLARALDREAFTITVYDLEVRIEPAQQRLGARGRIILRNDSAQPQKIVTLQISSSLSWRSIRAGNKPLQFVTQPFTSDVDHTGALSEAIVTLPAEVRPKDSVELEIGYEGVVPLDMTRLTRVGIPEEIARHTSWDQIGKSFTAVRGAGYVTWYPITTESADFSESNSLFEVVNRWKAREAGSEFRASLELTGVGADPDFRLVCGGDDIGTKISDRDNGSAEHEQPENRRVQASCSSNRFGLLAPTFAAASYIRSSKPPLTVLALAGHESGASTYMDAFDPASKFVTEWFGNPTAPIAIADFADPHAAPFESGVLLMVSLAGQDTKLAGINLVHEMVHSAFVSRQPWVSEGLAHFAEAVYREQQGGREAALDLLGLHRAAFIDSEKEVAASGPTKPGQPLSTTYDETYYRSKAAYVWWMLRDMVGAPALKEAIHNYRAADDTDLKYVERLIEAASKRDLSVFFDDWVYHDRGLPDLHVQSAHAWQDESETNDKKVQMVTVTLENLGRAAAEVPFTIRCADSEVTNRLEISAKSTASTRVQLPCAPVEVLVNDGSVPESDLTNNVFKITAQQEILHNK